MIKKQFEDYLAAAQIIQEPFFEKKIETAVRIVGKSLRGGHKVLIAGNGGSAADAQHFAAELVGRYKHERAGYAAFALTTDTSILTAWSNDKDFKDVFAREVEALGQAGDVLIGISTSGNSENIIRALKRAKEHGLKTVALLGNAGGRTKGIADADIIVASNDTPRIQEVQMFVLHVIAEEVEAMLSSRTGSRRIISR